ncbi:LD-carboxypeptidase [Streptomyces sp. NPDC059442]|uniref:S66 peptidase family protein n=1 Tax=Streptomyces sp. NPDC059442 TaxID=3346830 RepID=UPI0036B9F4CB
MTAATRRRVYPPLLRPGDTVALVAPAGPVSSQEIAAAQAHLVAWGLQVRSTSRLSRTHHEYLAGSDDERLTDFTEAWLDPAVRAVLCARGGYGTQRIADRLDYRLLATAGPKFLVGSSDITCLLQAVGDQLDLITLHGPMPACRPVREDPETARHLHDALFGPLPQAIRLAGPAMVPGRAQGPLTGGNLTLLASSTGTRTAPTADGQLLVLEEVGEEPYRLDRSLTQLRRAGILQRAAGIVLGDFTRCGPPQQVLTLLHDRLSDLGVPVIAGLPAGHGTRQLTLPLGSCAVLDTAVHRITIPLPERTLC